jgi:uncharacterized protein YfaS (alpha-2-macroglobulin family)
MQVIGKRHFGRRRFRPAVAAARAPAASCSIRLLFWKGTVKLDAKGEATVQVPLNDSLTAFRIVAIASAAGIVRHGQHGYPQLAGPDLMSGLPTLVREGDQLRAGLYGAQHFGGIPGRGPQRHGGRQGACRAQA